MPRTISRIDMGGASQVQFLRNGAPDPAITVNNLQVDAMGSTVTAKLTISANAAPGARTVAVTTPGGTATSAQSFTVVDNTPPVISGMTANPSTLWPPNHKFVDVTINYTVTDNCDAPSLISCTLSVSSNEPVNGFHVILSSGTAATVRSKPSCALRSGAIKD